jgi:hypothetical protein
MFIAVSFPWCAASLASSSRQVQIPWAATDPNNRVGAGFWERCRHGLQIEFGCAAGIFGERHAFGSGLRT